MFSTNTDGEKELILRSDDEYEVRGRESYPWSKESARGRCWCLDESTGVAVVTTTFLATTSFLQCPILSSSFDLIHLRPPLSLSAT